MKTWMSEERELTGFYMMSSFSFLKKSKQPFFLKKNIYLQERLRLCVCVHVVG